MTKKITATTPVGVFTRRTARTYSHVIVQHTTAADLEASRLAQIEHLTRSTARLRERVELNHDDHDYAYCLARAEEALAKVPSTPITEDGYEAFSWVGRPDLLASRLKGKPYLTAYPVDA
jgi:hypothetical protein